MVDVALQHALASCYLIYIHSTTRSEVAHGLGQVHLDVTSLRIAFERECLCAIVGLPYERNRCRPLLAIHTIRDGAFHDCAVAGILARNVFHTVELVDRTQVDCHIARYGFALTPLRVP